MRRVHITGLVLAVMLAISSASLRGTVLSGGDYFDYPDAVYSDNGSWVLAFSACTVFTCPGVINGPSAFLLMHSAGGNNWNSFSDSAYSGGCAGYHTDQSFPAWPARATMQTDGNFVLYNEGATEYPAWQTHTHGNSGSYLNIQDDGNLVVYNSSWVPIWYTQC
ncbi:MAG: hypothetical protein U0Q11_04595 [Vicinamibacterales bacterium]